MKNVFHNFFQNIPNVFRGRNLAWHLAAIFLTFIIVISGLDWSFFLLTRGEILRVLFFPAIIIGGILPLILPIIIWFFSKVKKNILCEMTVYLLIQSEVLAWSISSLYKIFTGRIPPPPFFESFPQSMIDISHGFQFGFWRGGIFWGWPSSHTTVAFATALALWEFYPKNKILRTAVIIYAAYVGAGVAITGIHWLSEAVAGAIVGAMIGRIVGKSFQNMRSKKTPCIAN